MYILYVKVKHQKQVQNRIFHKERESLIMFSFWGDVHAESGGIIPLRDIALEFGHKVLHPTWVVCITVSFTLTMCTIRETQTTMRFQ